MIAARRLQMRLGPIVLLLIVSVCALAQSGNIRASTPESRIEELRQQGSEALFNLDYQAARKIFKEISRVSPDDPLGPQMLAWTLLLESLNNSRLRQGAIYSSQSYEAHAEDKPDARVTQEFRDLTRQAAQLAKSRLQSNPRDPHILHTLGGVETARAAFALTFEGRNLASLRAASRAVDRHREVIKLDPGFYDAELTLGLYDYVVGSLSLPTKLFVSLSGVRGSRKGGIVRLERVAKQGRWERDNAKLLLITFYKREKRFTESLATSRALQEKYPRNYLFKLETADTLTCQAAAERQANRIDTANVLEKEAFIIFNSLIRDYSAPNAPARRLDLIHFRYGEALDLLGQSDRAAQQFLSTASASAADPRLVTKAHLRRAQSLDLASKRSEALVAYRLVMTRPNTGDAHEEARRGLKEPYRKTK